MTEEKNELKEFYAYLALRKRAFEYKYKLIQDNRGYLQLRLFHYPNSLKYLDLMSQWFIRNLNKGVATRRDKIITVFVFRLTGDKRLCRRYANSNGVFTLRGAESLCKALDRINKPLTTKYPISINRRGSTGLKKGEALRVALEEFLTALPDDLFFEWKLSDIYDYLREQEIFCLNDFMAYQLSSDLSFINELHIKINLIKTLPETAREVYKKVTGKNRFIQKEFEDFVYDTMDKYRSMTFVSLKEKMVLPYDIVNMLLGYHYYTGNNSSAGFSRYRNYPRIRAVKLDDISISRSMYEYYKTYGLHRQAD